jgi:hypothetical protein
MAEDTPPDIVNLQEESSVDWLRSTRDETDDPIGETADAGDEIEGADTDTDTNDDGSDE